MSPPPDTVGVLCTVQPEPFEISTSGPQNATKPLVRAANAKTPVITSGSGPYYVEFRSRYAWDYLRQLATIPADKAFRPLSESECPMVRR